MSYEVSKNVTKPLTEKILQQSDDLPSADEVKEAKSKAITDSKKREDEKNKQIKLAQDAKTQRTLEQLSEPGASSWLGALPLASHGFNLTKGEFQDGLEIRYNKQVSNLPSKCPCGSAFTTTRGVL